MGNATQIVDLRFHLSVHLSDRRGLISQPIQLNSSCIVVERMETPIRPSPVTRRNYSAPCEIKPKQFGDVYFFANNPLFFRKCTAP